MDRVLINLPEPAQRSLKTILINNINSTGNCVPIFRTLQERFKGLLFAKPDDQIQNGLVFPSANKSDVT